MGVGFEALSQGHKILAVIKKSKNPFLNLENCKVHIYNSCLYEFKYMVVLKVNAFAVGEDSLDLRGLYASACLLAHSCIANTAHTDDDNYRLTLYASLPIAKGDTISLSYTNTLLVSISAVCSQLSNSKLSSFTICIQDKDLLLHTSRSIKYYNK